MEVTVQNSPTNDSPLRLGIASGSIARFRFGAALFAIQTGTVAPTINLDEPDPECDLDYVPNKSKAANVDVALCNCIGFGSKNSALVLEKVRA